MNQREQINAYRAVLIKVLKDLHDSSEIAESQKDLICNWGQQLKEEIEKVLTA